MLTVLAGEVQRWHRGILFGATAAITAGLCEETNDISIPAEGSHVHGRHAFLVSAVGVGAVLKEHLDQFGACATLTRKHQRRIAIDVGSTRMKWRCEIKECVRYGRRFTRDLAKGEK